MREKKSKFSDLAVKHGLGAYLGRGWRPWGILQTIAIFLGAVSTTFGVFLLWPAKDTPGYVICGIMIGAGAPSLLIGLALRLRRPPVYFFTEGIVHVRRRRARGFRWDELKVHGRTGNASYLSLQVTVDREFLADVDKAPRPVLALLSERRQAATRAAELLRQERRARAQADAPPPGSPAPDGPGR